MAARAFTGHGTFIYDAEATIRRYGSAAQVADAVTDLGMRHAWVRIHGRAAPHAPQPTKDLVGALTAGGIAVAGWGWCQGDDPRKEARLAASALARFALTDYVTDIEEGVNGAEWTTAEIVAFFETLKGGAAAPASIALSTHAFIDWHKPELMRAADPFVDAFAPQVYWYNHPTRKMLKAVNADPNRYPLDNPAAYANLCIDRWHAITAKPLVVSGQAYWGEPPEFTRAVAEQKLAAFLADFNRWPDIVALNWWHLGGKDQNAMSFAMYQAIRAAGIDARFP